MLTKKLHSVIKQGLRTFFSILTNVKFMHFGKHFYLQTLLGERSDTFRDSLSRYLQAVELVTYPEVLLWQRILRRLIQNVKLVIGKENFKIQSCF